MIVSFTVNGQPRTADVAGWESLLRVLRHHLDLTGTKNACEQGECGSCTVVMDGELVCACLVMAADAEGASIRTVEGLGNPDVLHPLQEAFVAEGAVQCGFCTPGLIVAAAHLLDRTPRPDDDEIREALSGNLCRCTGYGSVIRAVRAAAGGDR